MAILSQMSWGQWFVGMTLLGTCCLLILVVLLQRGRGGGLSGAFGGGGGSSAFGAKTGDVFTWITVVVATLFVGLSVAANFVFDESAPPRAQAADVSETPAQEPPGDTTTAPSPGSELPPAPSGPPLGVEPGTTTQSEGADSGQAAPPEEEPSDVGEGSPTDEPARDQPAP